MWPRGAGDEDELCKAVADLVAENLRMKGGALSDRMFRGSLQTQVAQGGDRPSQRSGGCLADQRVENEKVGSASGNGRAAAGGHRGGREGF